MRRFARAMLALSLVFAWSTYALAGTIYLSQASSDETHPSVLDAMVQFEIVGTTLEITLNNTTADPSQYSIDELFFNASANVTSLSNLTVSDSTSWSLYTPSPANDTVADGFGIFDYAVKADVLSAALQSADSVVFSFDIVCAGACVQDDFVGGSYLGETFSQVPPGYRPAQVAAKFVQGPYDDSAYGAGNDEGFPPVPEPTTLTLLGLGLTGLVAFGRRGGQRRM